MEQIRFLAEQFRDAIEQAKENGETDPLGFFEKFPRGCCGDTSDLLGHFLLEKGIETDYICGKCPAKNHWENPQSHAWLLLDNETVIDITGDQFKDDDHFLRYNHSVYFGPIDDFHNLFMTEGFNKRKSVFLNQLNLMEPHIFFDIYYKIKKYL